MKHNAVKHQQNPSGSSSSSSSTFTPRNSPLPGVLEQE
jgi:hypothetical protein